MSVLESRTPRLKAGLGAKQCFSAPECFSRTRGLLWTAKAQLRYSTYHRPGTTEFVISCIAHSFSSTSYIIYSELAFSKVKCRPTRQLKGVFKASYSRTSCDPRSGQKEGGTRFEMYLLPRNCHGQKAQLIGSYNYAN